MTPYPELGTLVRVTHMRNSGKIARITQLEVKTIDRCGVDLSGQIMVQFNDGSQLTYHYSWLVPLSPLEQLALCAED